MLETHTHADHLSGRRRLLKATGMRAQTPPEVSELELGETWIRPLATPGHRPEHTCYLVEDGSRGPAPWLVLTGDSLFVGDVARPDLAVDPEEGARGLHRSLGRLLELADHVEVWPGHAGGSLCGGGGISEKPVSTIGFERPHNRFAQIDGEEAFVEALTSELDPQPPNFERIVELNRHGPPTAPAVLQPLTPSRVQELLDVGAVVLDGREPREFDGAHLPGSLNVTAAKTGIGARAAWVVEPETDIVLVGSGDEEAQRLGRMLEAVGFLSLRGFLSGGLAAWQEAGLQVETTPALDVPGLAEQLRHGGAALLDVREEAEWREGHVPGSLHVP